MIISTFLSKEPQFFKSKGKPESFGSYSGVDLRRSWLFHFEKEINNKKTMLKMFLNFVLWFTSNLFCFDKLAFKLTELFYQEFFWNHHCIYQCTRFGN